MKSVKQIAELIVAQWDKHDKFREHETVLFNNGVEPDDVAVARALIEALKELENYRIASVQSIIDNRKVLTDLFDYDIPKDDSDD